jgi:hypothetical protein
MIITFLFCPADGRTSPTLNRAVIGSPTIVVLAQALIVSARRAWCRGSFTGQARQVSHVGALPWISTEEDTLQDGFVPVRLSDADQFIGSHG